MKKLRFIMPLWFFVIVAAFSALVMLLWNWLMPTIFGLTVINFWQAVGLFALARILFGGFRFFDKARMMHARMHDESGNRIHKKWNTMSAEQRREFIEKRRKFGFRHPHPFFNMEEHDEEHETEGK